MSKGKIIFKRSIKVLVYLLLSLAVILLSLWLFINSDYGKDFIKNQAQHYLQNKINTKVSIGKLNYDLPNGITLEQIYIEDKNKDTLLYAGKIDVKIKMMDLLDGEVNMSKLSVSDVYANLYSSKGNADFNYQFIIDAFASNDNPGTTTNLKDTSTLKFNIKNVALNKIRINYKDIYGGTELVSAISKSEINFNSINLEKSVYDIKDIAADGISINMQLYKGNVVQNVPVAIASEMPIITVHHTDFKNSNIKFNDTENELFFSNQSHQLEANYFYVDLNKQLIQNKSILIDSADIIFNYKSYENDIDTSTTSSPWIFNAANVAVKRSHLIYNDNTAPSIDGFDAFIEAQHFTEEVQNVLFTQIN